MDQKTLFAGLALSLVAVGCSSSHETVSAATGVYDLSIASESDPCSPVRATGPMGTAAVVQQGALLTVTAPDLTSSAPMLVALNSVSGYSQVQTEALTSCTAATLERTYTVIGTNDSGFDVAYRESWTGLSTCGAAMHAIMPAAPSVDCSADLVMHYHLQSACGAACEVHVLADGTAACHC